MVSLLVVEDGIPSAAGASAFMPTNAYAVRIASPRAKTTVSVLRPPAAAERPQPPVCNFYYNYLPRTVGSGVVGNIK